MIVKIDDAILCNFEFLYEISILFNREAPSRINSHSSYRPIFQITNAQCKPQTNGRSLKLRLSAIISHRFGHKTDWLWVLVYFGMTYFNLSLHFVGNLMRMRFPIWSNQLCSSQSTVYKLRSFPFTIEKRKRNARLVCHMFSFHFHIFWICSLKRTFRI